MKTKILLILFPALVAGCGMTHGERTDYQDGAARVAALEVPPGLVLPKANAHYTIPAGGKTDYQNDAAKVVALEAPPELVLPKANAQSTVPAGGKTDSESYSEYVKDSAQSAAKAAAVATVPPRQRTLPGGGKGIVIDQPFDRCWLTVGVALDRAGITVVDKDRSKGLFYLKGGNQVTVRTDEAGCEVAAGNGSGAVSDETNNVIDALYKGLGK